jgi:hypothetical protein
MLAVVVGMAALAIDGSRAYALRRDLQAAVDAAALAAADKLQQTGSYTSAEQAATTMFGTNLRLYNPPSCSGYGMPGAGSFTVTCTFTGGTVLTQVVSALGPQGSRFSLTATSSLQLQFAKILTNGSNPTLSSSASGGVNNLLYTPAVAALDQAGCGGTGGTALSINGSGSLSVNGDVVSGGAVTVSGASLVVAGDIYARCQSSIPGSVTNSCYPSGASTPCTFPDVAGATRSGFHFVDPNYPPPSVTGGSQGAPVSNVELPPGVYASNPNFNSGDCWFLKGGVFDWQGGYTNSGDFVSNELKPPDEPLVTNNKTVSGHQFWNTKGVNCAGAFQVNTISGIPDVDSGNWGFELTSLRTDSYAGTNYRRESAPSACRSVLAHLGDVIQIQVSNVPGATSYNVYASPLNNGCNGPWGLAGNIPVVGTVSNNNTNPCPAFTGAGCTLGHETAVFDGTILSPLFAPNPLASPGTFQAYPPDAEAAPLLASVPNQNPPRGAGSAGDRANENACESASGTRVTCPAAVTPGAVVFYLPSGACINATNGSDTYVYSGYQYDWLAVYEPGVGHPTANTCSNALGANGNSAFIGLVYAPSATIGVTSSFVYESPATGGLMGDFVTFSGTMPAVNYSASYAPIAPAGRLVS